MPSMALQKPAFGPQLHRAWRTRIRRCLERGQGRLYGASRPRFPERPGEGPLTEPTTAAQPRPQKPLKLPQSRPPTTAGATRRGGENSPVAKVRLERCISGNAQRIAAAEQISRGIEYVDQKVRGLAGIQPRD